MSMIVTLVMALLVGDPNTANATATATADTAPAASAPKAEMVVYGATPAGIAFAVRAARDGHPVLLVHYQDHLGGMPAEGISIWDTLYLGARAPLYDELRQAIYDHYRDTYGGDSPQFKASHPGHPKTLFEAHVLEKLLTEMVQREPLITVKRGYFPSKATRKGPLLETVTFSARHRAESFTASAPIFVDCSYEADLAAVAKAPYRIGREARSEYQEPHAGIIYMRNVPWPPTGIDTTTLDKARKLRLFHYDVWQEPILPDSTGEADPAVQAFNMRTVLTTDPDNLVPIDKPEGYDPALARSLLNQASGFIGPLPNSKYCWNRPELVGEQNAYFEASWPEREAIIAKHRLATLSLLYYLQNDPSVPEKRREHFRRYGLPKDEFADNAHMPREVYVREGRRVMGRQLFTEHDARLAEGIDRAPIHADSIALTEWFMDAHACRPERAKSQRSLPEGEFFLKNQTFPGQVPYGTIIPKGIDNLMVPVCLSATHVGWGTIRLEPTWMVIAESSAVAAQMALEKGLTPAAIPVDQLIPRLAKRRILTTFFNDVGLDRQAKSLPALTYLGTQGFFGSYDARPKAPLLREQAEAWAAATGEMLGDKTANVSARAQQMYAIEQRERKPAAPNESAAPNKPAASNESDAQSVTRSQFLELLAQQLPKGQPLPRELETTKAASPSDSALTREEACQLIFAVLHPANEANSLDPKDPSSK